MNIVAFVLSVFPAFFSFLQGGCAGGCAGGMMRLSQSFGGSVDRDFALLGATGIGVMLAALLAMIGGSLALARKKGAAVFLMISVGLCALAYLGGFGDASIWGILYTFAAVCAAADAKEHQKAEATSPSHPGSQSPDFTGQTQERDAWPSPGTPGGGASGAVSRSPKENGSIAGLETEALVKRAFLFLEDGSFPMAIQYLEQALNQDPENSQAYLGLLMTELSARSEEDLRNHPTPLEDNRNYQRAVRFADEEGKACLAELVRANRERIERQRTEELEARYTQALELKSRARCVSDYRQLATLFGELGSYRDSEACRIMAEGKRREYERKANKMNIIVLSSFLMALIIVIVFLNRESLTSFFRSKLPQETSAPSLRSTPVQKTEKPVPQVPDRTEHPAPPAASGGQGTSPETIMVLGIRERAITLYERPDLNGPIVGSLPSNHVFPILEAWVDPSTSKRWYRAASQKHGRGWIPEDGVRLEGQEEILSDFVEYGEESFNSMRREAEEDERLLQRFITEKRIPSHVVASGRIYLVRSYGYSLMEVRGSKVNLRREPNTRSAVIIQMNEGYPVNADAYWTSADGRETWFYVRTPDGKEGWIFGEFTKDRPR